VTGPHTDADGVLRSLLQSSGLETEGLASDEMRRLITVFVQERLAKSQHVVVEVDDADAFNRAAWNEIEVLLRLGKSERGLELLLSLVHLDDASSPAAEYVRQQETLTFTILAWMTRAEVSSYLRWRLDRFGLAGINTPAATRLIATCTKGCFTAVDHICQMALLLLRNRAGDQINVNVVSEAVRLLQQRNQVRDTSRAGVSEAQLIVSLDGKVIREAPLVDHILIGRSHLNGLCLDSSYLSRHHVAIVRGEDTYHLRDLNSVNGVSLNGQSVRSVPLSNGDVFCIGPFRIKLRMQEQLARQPVDNVAPSELADTALMPAPGYPEPAHLKVIK